MARARAIGIDLGTTYSAVAWIHEAGKTAMISNTEGDILTPSVVLFEDHEVLVGKDAKRVGVLKAERVAATVKRDMGSEFYARTIRGERLAPEVIQAYILRKLRMEIVRAAGPDYQAVITVPAFFDEPRRNATAQAGEMAGLNVLDIVNEPMAAALAFGEQLGYLGKSGTPLGRRSILVYDLGGGTFDVTLVDLEPGDLQTVATDGDVQLGGYDWDMRLLDHAAEEFRREHRQDPRQDPNSLQHLVAEVEQAKHTLSARGKATLRVEHAGRSSNVTFTREQFEQLTADLLQRTSHTTRQLLSTAGRTWASVTDVLLVGGSTRMPMVSRMLRELSGKEPNHSVHPDEAVARGAAIYAQYFLSLGGEFSEGPSFQVTNVNAHSLGIAGIDPQTLRKCNSILIPRNTPLPARVTREFCTKTDGQRSIEIQVLEGESSLPGECTSIGRTGIRDLPPNLPHGSPIDVTYAYAVNGRLSVSARVRATGQQASLELIRDQSLSEDHVAQYKRVLAGGGGLNSLVSLTQASRVSGTAGRSSTHRVERPDTESPATVSEARPAPKAILHPIPLGPAEPRAVPLLERLTGAMARLSERLSSSTGSGAESPPAIDSEEKPARPWRVVPYAPSPLAAVAGLLLFTVIGMGIGYYILCWLLPAEYNYFNLPLPGVSQPSEPLPETNDQPPAE